MKAEWTNADSLTASQTTKAILVIDDMPKCCDGCPCTDYMFCYATQKELEIDWEANKPSWCPLKPMPKEMPNVNPASGWWGWNKILDRVIEEQIKVVDFAKGWNACIEEIEK